MKENAHKKYKHFTHKKIIIEHTKNMQKSHIKNAKTVFLKYNLGVHERLSKFSGVVYAAGVHRCTFTYSRSLP